MDLGGGLDRFKIYKQRLLVIPGGVGQTQPAPQSGGQFQPDSLLPPANPPEEALFLWCQINIKPPRQGEKSARSEQQSSIAPK